ncbi:MAG: beta-ketoacyl synthase chain length factor [Bdellovibrionales bacterium]
MTLNILGAGVFVSEDLQGFAVPPAWRKATRNMIMATASIDKALKKVSGLEIAGNPDVGFVLGSIAGELETSADFMSTWAKSRMARPVLFQNSLHNATTGFASIHFKIVGPSFTMSGLEGTPEECVSMARSLLLEKICRVCIVTLVEGHKNMATWIGESMVNEGACSLVLSTEENCAALGLKSLGDLPSDMSNLNYSPNEKTKPLVSISESGFFARAVELGART